MSCMIFVAWKWGLFYSLHPQQKRNFFKALVRRKINCVSAPWSTTDWPLQNSFYLIGSGNAFQPLSKWNLIIVPMPQLNKWQFSHKTVFFSSPPPIVGVITHTTNYVCERKRMSNGSLLQCFPQFSWRVIKNNAPMYHRHPRRAGNWFWVGSEEELYVQCFKERRC